MVFEVMFPTYAHYCWRPAITQVLLRHDHETQTKILGPFDTAIIYEGEEPFLDLANSLERGEKPLVSSKVQSIDFERAPCTGF
jgi:hypothetical protein